MAGNSKSSAAAVSVASNTILVVLKLVVGLSIGSVSVISEAIHSSNDLLAAVIAFLSVRFAGKPADQEHPYGHGKMENVSGTIEAVLIFLAALWIIYEAVTKILHGVELQSVDLGIGVMALSTVANTFVSAYLYRRARETESVALEADAAHLRTDVITSLGVFLGLVLVRVTGWKVLDPAVAIGTALVIIRTAYAMTRRSFVDLLDRRLPDEEESTARRIISEHYGDFVEFHDLRSRRAGSERHIDLHLVVPAKTTVEEAHRLCDHLEDEIGAQLRNTSITIHLEPCHGQCEDCDSTRYTTEGPCRQ
jgi:cation diffusion facilitator family transporter